jgi:hypothetical protein
VGAQGGAPPHDGYRSTVNVPVLLQLPQPVGEQARTRQYQVPFASVGKPSAPSAMLCAVMLPESLLR